MGVGGVAKAVAEEHEDHQAQVAAAQASAAAARYAHEVGPAQDRQDDSDAEAHQYTRSTGHVGVGAAVRPTHSRRDEG